jgi:hypothetical protein
MINFIGRHISLHPTRYYFIKHSFIALINKNFHENDAVDKRDYCFQIHVPAELALPATSMFITLSAHCITIIPRSTVSVSLYRKMRSRI